MSAILEALPSYFPELTEWLTISCLIFFLVKPAQNGLKPSAINYLGTWLAGPHLREAYRQVLRAYLRFFDRTFKVSFILREIPVISFWRIVISTVASICVIFIVFAPNGIFLDDLWAFFNPASIDLSESEYLISDTRAISEQNGQNIIREVLQYNVFGYLVIAFFINFLVDYASACETRFMLSRALGGSAFSKLVVVFIDVFLTCLIIVTGIVLVNLMHDVYLSFVYDSDIKLIEFSFLYSLLLLVPSRMIA